MEGVEAEVQDGPMPRMQQPMEVVRDRRLIIMRHGCGSFVALGAGRAAGLITRCGASAGSRTASARGRVIPVTARSTT